MENILVGGKLVLLMDILEQCQLVGDKILVFSQSLVTLDLIEEFLASHRPSRDVTNKVNVSSFVIKN